MSVTGLLRLKLGASRTGPTKRLVEDLHEVAILCNRARNAMARAWQRWREDNPKFKPPQAVDENGKPRTRRDGSPILISPAFPLKVKYEGREIGFRTYLYHAGRKASPGLAANMVSMLSGEVISNLGSNMPYTHQGRARQRWEAVVLNEANLMSARSISIPVPNNSAALCYCGVETTGSVATKSRKVLKLRGESGCTVAFPLFAGGDREITSPVVSLEVRQLSGGNREIVKKICRGEFKFADSELCFDEDKGWFFHLVYQQPDESMPWLEKERVAVLSAQKEGDYPFSIKTTIGEKEIVWKVGHGPLLARTFHRLDSRRKDMRTDYGVAGSGRKGHGHGRNQRDIRRVTRRVQHLANRIAKQAAAEVARFCARFGCGILEWKEPGMAVKPKLWFAVNKVQWTWNTFTGPLAHDCRKAGVRIVEPGEGKKAKRA